jgi:hypothetical protein
MKMNLGIAALLYFGVPIVAAIGILHAYVAITGDETGEGIGEFGRKYVPSMYPYEGPRYNSSQYGSNTTANNMTTITSIGE